MLSATSEVSKLSIAPRIARMSAASNTINTVSFESEGMMNSGKPVGMAPNTGTLLKPRLATVPTIKAARGPGRYRPQLAGHKNTMARVNTPMPNASRFGLLIA